MDDIKTLSTKDFFDDGDILVYVVMHETYDFGILVKSIHLSWEDAVNSLDRLYPESELHIESDWTIGLEIGLQNYPFAKRVRFEKMIWDLGDEGYLWIDIWNATKGNMVPFDDVHICHIDSDRADSHHCNEKKELEYKP